MDPSNSKQTAIYDLPPVADGELAARDAETTGGASLSEQLLVENVVWFCRLRWGVIAILSALGVLSLFPALMRRIGLRTGPDWPFALAGVLAVYNLVFLACARAPRKAGRPLRPVISLWFQIVLDLIVLTAVVHFVGSKETFIAFAYLFHIVLACIFFSRPQSLAVTGVACALYVGCVAAEGAGILSPLRSIYALPPMAMRLAPSSGSALVVEVPIVSSWLVVWYLASHLSTMVRKRDNELARTNRRLIAAQAERAKHMLRTTHELKAPFAAIHANTQLLLKGHCGVLSDEALEVARRISARCSRLANEIQEMLQLANLSSTGQEPLPRVDLDLAEMLEWCAVQIEPIARQRGVVFEKDLRPAHVVGAEDHLKMIFRNLLSNAVTYSHKGGSVRVRCEARPDSSSIVTIADDGIGIFPEKLSHIFDEHYRTKEAVRHNKESSGLGLAIVKHVAQIHGIDVRVTSRPGAGTTFELHLPSGRVRRADTKETQDGLSADSG